MNFLKDWLRDKTSLFSVIVPAVALSTAFQYNWALYFNFDYFIVRAIFSGIVFVLILGLLTFLLSYVFDPKGKQKAIQKFSLANSVLLISVSIFFLEPLRYEILAISLGLLPVSYLFVCASIL